MGGEDHNEVFSCLLDKTCQVLATTQVSPRSIRVVFSDPPSDCARRSETVRSRPGRRFKGWGTADIASGSGLADAQRVRS